MLDGRMMYDTVMSFKDHECIRGDIEVLDDSDVVHVYSGARLSEHYSYSEYTHSVVNNIKYFHVDVVLNFISRGGEVITTDHSFSLHINRDTNDIVSVVIESVSFIVAQRVYSYADGTASRLSLECHRESPVIMGRRRTVV